MANLFKQGNEKIENPLVVVMFLVYCALFVVACGLFIEDYSTSLLGYQRLPTQKANDWVIPLVALLPQLGQVGFLYVFASDTSKRWGALVAIALHVADVTTDMAFKIGSNLSAPMFLLTLAETEILYTIGSEVLLTVSFGMILALLPRVGNSLGLTVRKSVQPSTSSSPPGERPPFPRAAMHNAQSREERRRIAQEWENGRTTFGGNE